MQNTYAQQEDMLSGRLKDEKEEAVRFANVSVLTTADSVLVTGVVSNEEGSFQIKSPAPGKYFLRISAIGYVNTETQSFAVTDGNFNKDFGTLILKEDVKLLNDVTVQSLRPQVIHEVDKMVVSVEGTALASGSTAFEVLGKSPGVWIDQDGNIQLNGRAGVKIMIDGRLTYLSAKELQNMLEGMSAENIKTIEIITNPSAKYDAEGASGIINITLKKNHMLGLNGSIYAGYQYNALHGYATGANINYKKGKWSSSANVDVARRMRLRTSHMEREFNEENTSTRFDQQGREEVSRFVPSVRLSTDYELNEKHSIGAMVNLSFQEGKHDFATQSYLSGAHLQDNLFIDAHNYTTYRFGNGAFNLHYLGKLDTTGTTFSADLDYVKLINQGNADFINRFYQVENNALINEDLLTTDNPTYYDIYSAKMDFTKSLPDFGKLEMGLKASHVVSDNELNFYQIENGERQPDENRSNHFIYQENIYAAYVNFNAKLSEQWSLQSGLRAEQTIAEGRSVTLDQATPRKYLNLFPSLFIQQKVSDHYQISYNYSRRIDRPRYESLNPFIFYLDPYTWAQGNPYLRPQYTHSFQISQTLNGNYNLVLGYALTNGYMAEVPGQNNETNTTVFQQQNVDHFKDISATLVAPIQITPKWTMNNNLTFAYQNFTTVLDQDQVINDQMFFYAQSTQTVQLAKGIRMEVNAGYQSTAVYGLYRIEPNWWVDAGLKKSLLHDKLDLSINVTDIFRTRKVVGGANINGNVNAFDQYFSAQSFGLNLRYRFSKGEKFEMKKRNVDLEELNRAGGN